MRRSDCLWCGCANHSCDARIHPAAALIRLHSDYYRPLYWCAYGPAAGEQLLVIHGGPGAHHDYLLPQMLHLAKRYNVIFYDQRGGGKSKSDEREHVTWKTHVMDMHAIIRELRYRSPSIVAYSFGGMLALLYCDRGARSTTACNAHRDWHSSIRAPVKMEYRQAVRGRIPRRQNGMQIRRMREELAESGLREQDPAEYRQRAFELAVAPYFADPAKSPESHPVPRDRPGADSPSGRAWAPDYDILQDLKAMGFPAMFIHGRDDPIPTRPQ